MTALRTAFLLCLLALFALPASAQDLTFSGCTDAAGRKVPTRLDTESPLLVTTLMENGRPTIVYNPRALPDLTDAARAFLYAHECARHNLGQARYVRTEASAQAADCWGLATLQRSGMLREDDAVSALQSSLVFTPQQWLRVPGPVRGFALASCPTARVATPSNPRWNQCVHRCGDRLFHCGRSQSCQSTYDACQAACPR